MKINNYLKMLMVLFLLINVSACASSLVKRTKSGYDNVLTLTVEPKIFSSDHKMAMGVTWDETMPDKYYNIGVLILRGQLKASKDSKININIDGSKYILDIIDTENKTKIDSHHVYMANVERTSQTDELVLSFKISDKIIFDMAKSKSSTVMVNLANNLRVEDKADWIVKNYFNDFIFEKQSTKSIYPNSTNKKVN